MTSTPAVETVVYYDGNCVMCNGFVGYLAKRDLPDTLWFAPQSSAAFAALLKVYPALGTVDSIVVVRRVAGDVERVLVKAEAITKVLAMVSPAYRPLDWVRAALRWPADFVYDLVASLRPKVDDSACPLPPPAVARRMLREAVA